MQHRGGVDGGWGEVGGGDRQQLGQIGIGPERNGGCRGKFT